MRLSGKEVKFIRKTAVGFLIGKRLMVSERKIPPLSPYKSERKTKALIQKLKELGLVE